MKKRLIITIMLLVCIFLMLGCQTVEKEERMEVDGIVTKMTYKAQYTTSTPMYTGKVFVLIPQIHSAQYLVTISYGDLSATFDDEKLYESVSEGDTIKVILYRGYDDEGNLTQEELQLPE